VGGLSELCHKCVTDVWERLTEMKNNEAYHANYTFISQFHTINPYIIAARNVEAKGLSNMSLSSE